MSFKFKNVSAIIAIIESPILITTSYHRNCPSLFNIKHRLHILSGVIIYNNNNSQLPTRKFLEPRVLVRGLMHFEVVRLSYMVHPIVTLWWLLAVLRKYLFKLPLQSQEAMHPSETLWTFATPRPLVLHASVRYNLTL